MNVLNEETEAFAQDIFEEHMRQIREHPDVDTVFDYLKRAVGKESLSDPDEIELLLKSNTIDYQSFYQMYPMLDQDIMYVSLNPGMSNIEKKDFTNEGKYGIQTEVDSLEKLILESSRRFSSWVPDSELGDIIESMQTNLSLLPDCDIMPVTEYIDVSGPKEIENSYFTDVYHTRLIKLQTSDRGNLTDEILEASDNQNASIKYWQERFIKELKLVDPDLLICGAGDAWKAIYNHYGPNGLNNIQARNGAHLTEDWVSLETGGNIPEIAKDTAAAGSYYVANEDLFIVTLYHESRFNWLGDPKRFDHDLRYIDSNINWN